MRIAFLADPESSNALYRSLLPMTALLARGHELRPIRADRIYLTTVHDVDVLHVHRYWDATTLKLVCEAKEHGAAVVWDEDDDFGTSPRGTIAHRRFGGYKREQRIAQVRRILPHVDLVTTPSDILARRFSELGATRVHTIENYVPSLFLRHARVPHDGVVIGWVAGGEHQYDAERLSIRAVLERVLDARPEVRVVSIGLGLGINHERYRHIKDVPLLARERRTLTSGGRTTRVSLGKFAPGGIANFTAQFDIGIAPIADVRFNQARSNIKLKEYAAGGTPWLASPVGPYLGMGERQGGRLVADDGWYKALLGLVDDHRGRRRLAKRAAKWVAGETIEKNFACWERPLLELVESASAPKVAWA